MATQAGLRTSRELMKVLRPPVARYYPFDLHVHSPASYDVCGRGIFESLSPGLQECVRAVASREGFKVPVSAEVDVERHDRRMCDSATVECYFRELVSRRDAIVVEEGLSPTDNWAVVGITDHNTSHFACALSEHAWKHRPSDRLVVLPGIELDIQFPVPAAGSTCNIHVLCLFAPLTQPSDIRLAIEQSRQGSTTAWTFGSALSVADLPSAISALRGNGSYPAICVAAHVWSSKGVQREPTKHILASLDAKIVQLQAEIERASKDGSASEATELQGRLAKVLQDRGDHEGIHSEVLRLIGRCGFDALQVRDRSHESMYRKLHRFRDEHGRATPIVCSDAHTPQRAFACQSGIPFAKLSTSILSGDSPSALFREVKGRVLRFGETRTTYSVPGAVAEWIEGVEIVAEAEGSSCFWSDDNSITSVPDGKAGFVLPLSRNLNCLVGGRGCGKSAAVEAIAFLTQALEFEDEGKKRVKSDWYSRAAATLGGSFVRLIWKSSGTTGLGNLPKKALLVSRYFDPDGRHDPWEVRDVDGNAIVDDEFELPRARVLRAHQIEETARQENLQQLFDDLCGPRIGQLTRSIELVRGKLSSQREDILGTCKKLAGLTMQGSPLRQFGIRKAQFDAVNRDELQARFELVDRAAKAARHSAKIQKDWSELDSIGAVERIARRVSTFFANSASEMSDAGESPNLLHSET